MSVVVVAVVMAMLSRYFGPYGIIIMNVCCYKHCHVIVVKGFWALRDNIHKYIYCYNQCQGNDHGPDFDDMSSPF
jgi:hypothetical protein